MRALLIVDVQNDFCEGGSLAVDGGGAVARAINDYLAGGAGYGHPAGGAGYDHVVATADHHIDPGSHFADPPDYVSSWPRHCVAGTAGADLHPALDPGRIEIIFRKGEYEAAYSGFEGVALGVGLADWLRERGVEEVDIAGIATDYCVRATALDAVRAGLRTTVLVDLIAGVAPESSAAALEEMRDSGVHLAGTAQ